MSRNMMYELHASFKTIKEMLTDRGTDITLLENISVDDLELKMKSMLIFTVPVNDNMHIIYYMHTKFKINDIRKSLVDDKLTIVVFKEKINNLNKRNLREQMPNIEIFNIKELLFNVSHHSYVPKHEVVKDTEEIDGIMNTYNIRHRSMFPVIMRTDPMARYLNLGQGDIVRIRRQSPTAGEAIVYRVCA